MREADEAWARRWATPAALYQQGHGPKGRWMGSGSRAEQQLAESGRWRVIRRAEKGKGKHADAEQWARAQKDQRKGVYQICPIQSVTRPPQRPARSQRRRRRTRGGAIHINGGPHNGTVGVGEEGVAGGETPALRGSLMARGVNFIERRRRQSQVGAPCLGIHRARA